MSAVGAQAGAVLLADHLVDALVDPAPGPRSQRVGVQPTGAVAVPDTLTGAGAGVDAGTGVGTGAGVSLYDGIRAWETI